MSRRPDHGLLPYAGLLVAAVLAAAAWQAQQQSGSGPTHPTAGDETSLTAATSRS